MFPADLPNRHILAVFVHVSPDFLLLTQSEMEQELLHRDDKYHRSNEKLNRSTYPAGVARNL